MYYQSLSEVIHWTDGLVEYANATERRNLACHGIPVVNRTSASTPESCHREPDPTRPVWVRRSAGSFVNGFANTAADAQDAVICRFEKADLDLMLDTLMPQMADGYARDCSLALDHARQKVVRLSHHSVAHVDFLDEPRLDKFVSFMAAQGYHLPAGPPDEHFKPQPWFTGQSKGRDPRRDRP